MSGNLLLGYLGHPEPAANEAWHTGDLGYLDEDGFLYLTGRKKTAYATAYGRNVSPEWVESELTSHPLIAQAAVFGEGQAINVAVLVPVPRCQLARRPNAALEYINCGLPEYTHESAAGSSADQRSRTANGLANGAGGIDRHAVWRQYQTRIEQHYSAAERHVIF